MKKLVITSIFLVIISCNKTIYPIENAFVPSKDMGLNGKWINESNAKVYIEDAIQKIVISDGCQIVSADYSKYQNAINFSNITTAEKSCVVQNAYDQILKNTVLYQAKSANEIALIDANGNELLILNKN